MNENGWYVQSSHQARCDLCDWSGELTGDVSLANDQLRTHATGLHRQRRLAEWAASQPEPRNLGVQAGDDPADPIYRTCPMCGADAGYPCHSASGNTLWGYTHKGRLAATS